MTSFKIKDKIIIINFSLLIQFFNKRGMVFILMLVYLPGNTLTGNMLYTGLAQNEPIPAIYLKAPAYVMIGERTGKLEIAGDLIDGRIPYINLLGYSHTLIMNDIRKVIKTENEKPQQSESRPDTYPDNANDNEKTDTVSNTGEGSPPEGTEDRSGVSGVETVPANDKVIPVAIRGVPNAGKKVAITFDDGPYKDMTPKYISVLESFGARATFFVVGNRVQAFPEATLLLAEKGFEIGGHSYSHSNFKGKTKQAMKDDFIRCIEAIESVAGTKVSLFRPPYGAYNTTLLDTAVEFSQQTVGWNVDPKDWSGIKPEEIAKRVLKHSEDGSIILLHEGRQNTLQALPRIIEGLREMGYELVTVSELLFASEQPAAEEQPRSNEGEPPTEEQNTPAEDKRPADKEPSGGEQITSSYSIEITRFPGSGGNL
ncbi:MAG: polysaccharide deacetylase family protein [Tepidanaerobacteraceae bacterium]